MCLCILFKNMIQFTLFHTAKQKYLDAEDRESIYIPFPSASNTWTLTYIPGGDDEEHTLVKNGIEVGDSYVPFKRRFSKYNNGVDINSVERGDSGTFYFKDPDGNLAEIVRLEVVGEQKESRKTQRSS